MPDSVRWIEARLGDHVDLLTGFPFKSSEFSASPNDVRLLRGDNVGQGELEWENAKRWPVEQVYGLEGYVVKVGDVILAMDRPWIEAGLKFAAAGARDVPSLLVQRVARLRAGPALDQRFLRYLVASKEFTDYIVGIQTGTAVPHISGSQIQGFRFPLPPMPEQRAISQTLGSLDDKIEVNRRLNLTLEELCRTLFKFWFADFGPVRAKVEGVWKKGESLPGCPAEMWDLWPSEFEESEVGEVPQGWGVQALGQVAEITDSHHSGKPKRSKQGRVLVEAANIDEMGLLSLRDPYLIADEDWQYWTRRIQLRQGDCLLTKVGRVGDVGQVPGGLEAAMAGNLVDVRPSAIGPTYLFFALRSAFGRREIELNTVSGTIMDSLTIENLPRIRLLVPPDDLERTSESILRPMRAAMEENQVESVSLASLRNTLLPKLLSGEIRVPVGGGT